MRRFGMAWFFWRGVLALGLAVLLASLPAWGFAVWEQRKGGVYHNAHGVGVWTSETVSGQTSDPFSPLLRLFIKAPVARRDYSKFGTSLIELDSGALSVTDTRGWNFGWPCRSLRFAEEFAPSFSGMYAVSRGSVWYSGWRIEPAAGWEIILPIRPLWPGMAVNLGLWALACGGALLGVPIARKILWKKRGQCAVCGYDLRSLASGAHCPECGHRKDPVRASLPKC